MIGVDPAARLLEVARARAADAGLDATFALGEGAAIPVETGTVDVVVSVFGVIFAPDAVAAAAELARVVTPHGRVVLTAWLPGGAVGEIVRMARQTAMAALDAPPGPPPFAWHEQAKLSSLLGPHGFDVTLERHDHTLHGTLDRRVPRGPDGRSPAQQRLAGDARGAGARPTSRPASSTAPARSSPRPTRRRDAFAVTSSYVMAAATRSHL